jgi:hypothetical protein
MAYNKAWKGDGINKEKGKFSNGQIHSIMPVEHLCKDQRFIPPKSLLREIGAENPGDWIAINLDKKNKTATLSAAPFRGLENDSFDSDSRDAEELLDEIIKDNPEEHIEKNGGEEGLRYAIEIKSEGRAGSRKRILEIFEKIGAKPKDWVGFIYHKDKDGRVRWHLKVIKANQMKEMLQEK